MALSTKLLLFIALMANLAEGAIMVELGATVVRELRRHLGLANVTIISETIAEWPLETKRDLLAGGTCRVFKSLRQASHHLLTEVGEGLIIDMAGHAWDEVEVLAALPKLGLKAGSVFVLESEVLLPDPQLFLLNQHVYFLTLADGRVSEGYIVGSASVRRSLATFDAGSARFMALEGVDTNFKSRRSNFHRANLRCLVCPQNPYTLIAPPGGRGGGGGGDAVEEDIDGSGLAFDVVRPEQLGGLFRDLQVISTLQHTNNGCCSLYYIFCKLTGGHGEGAQLHLHLLPVQGPCMGGQVAERVVQWHGQNC